MQSTLQAYLQRPSPRTSSSTRPSTTVSRSTGHTIVADESPRLSVALGDEFVIPDHLLFSESTLVNSFPHSERNSAITLEDLARPSIPPKSIHRRRTCQNEVLSAADGTLKGLSPAEGDAPPEGKQHGNLEPSDGTAMGTCKKNVWGSKFSEDLQSDRQEIPRGAPAPAPDVPRHVVWADCTTVAPVPLRQPPILSGAHSAPSWTPSPSPVGERKWRGLRLKKLLCLVD
ncbi:hypothetical protein PV11_05225 [Exophiala sideris]|uniref:Uncharacterized protein n=1 Tax=Exophiala sideris TaxID=1016849 RepID=A0A0D1W2Z1_9EURO|nr:hypothetical protein PV11_05225 [Exophiala sideris]